MFQAIIASSPDNALQIAQQLSIGRLMIDGAKASEEIQRRQELLQPKDDYAIVDDFIQYIKQRGNLPTFFWTATEEELEFARVGVVRNPSAAFDVSTLPVGTLRFGTVGFFMSNMVVVETPDQSWFWYYRNRFGQAGSTVLHARQDKLPLYRSLGKLNRP